MNIPISQKKALLIGINYLKTPNSRLYGCINDVVNVRTMLTQKFGYIPSDILLLRDDDILAMPTRDNIMRALYAIAASTTNTSETWIHYSGHGSQMPDYDRDEKDGIDETIVPCDYPTRGMIGDDELFSAIAKMKGRVLLFFDSCHSGTVCDLQYSREYRGGEFIKTVNNSKAIANPNIIMMSGSKDNQYSADTYNSTTKQAVGAFTDKLVAAFSATPDNMELLKVYNTICFTLAVAGYEQLPIFSTTSDRIQYLYGSKMDLGANSFGALPPPPKPPAPVVVAPVRPPAKPPVMQTPAKLSFPFSLFQQMVKPSGGPVVKPSGGPVVKPPAKKAIVFSKPALPIPSVQMRKNRLYNIGTPVSRVQKPLQGMMNGIITSSK